MTHMVAVAGRLLRGLFALVALAGLLGGIPFGLVIFVGWPLPDHLPTVDEAVTALTSPLADRTLLNLLAILAWALWLLFLRDVVVEAILITVDAADARRGRSRPPRRPAGGPVRIVAAALVGAIAAAIVLDVVRGSVSTTTTKSAAVDAAARTPAIAVAPLHPAGETVVPRGPRPAFAVRPVPAITAIPAVGPADGSGNRAPWAPDAPGGVHPVVDGDNLWDIAESKLGDPHRWREIYVLNRGHRQANGYALTDPDEIHIGWVLALPARHHTPAPPTAPPDGSGPGQTPPGPTNPSPASPAPSSPTPSNPTPSSPTAPSSSASPSPGASSSVAPSGSRDPDGVVPQPSTSPAPGSPSTSTPSTAPETARGDDNSAAAGPDRGVGVYLSDGWVGIPLAAALVAAAALVWLRRRHGYVHRLPDRDPVDDATADATADAIADAIAIAIADDTDVDDAEDADLAPLPPVVSRLRQAVRQHNPDLLRPAGAAGPTVAEIANSGDEPPELPPIGPSGLDLAGLTGQVPAGGLGLVGSGAEPAARALLVATLTAGTNPADPDARGHVVIPAGALATLLRADAVDVAPMPRLTVTATLGQALTRVEELLIERRRLLQDHDVNDLAGMREVDPYHPPMPPILLLAEAPPTELRARLTTSLHLGNPLQINAVLLGEWSPGDTVTVDSDGYTGVDGQRLAVLDLATTLQLLQVLREAHTGQQRPSAPVETPPAVDQIAAERTGPPDAHIPPPPRPGTEPAAAVRTAIEITATDVTTASHAATTAVTASDDDTDAASANDVPVTPHPIRRHHRVRIRLLGTPAILDRDGAPINGLRHYARELLTYLAVHRGGAQLSAIMEAFWPNATVTRARERLSTEASNLRAVIREAASDKDKRTNPVVNTGSRYHLDPDLVDIDLWTVLDALRQAAATDPTVTDPAARAVSLRTAVDAHTGDLADGYDYDWIEQPREQIRRHGIRARLQLADLTTDTNPAEAATLIQTAADFDPYNEDLARRAMRAAARTGDADAVRTRLNRLRSALDEIDEEPSAETIALTAQLHRDISDTRRRRRHNQPGHPPPPADDGAANP